MSTPRHTRVTASCLALAVAVIASVLGAAPHTASAANANPQSIGLGFGETTGVEHIQSNGHIIVSGDDAVQVRDGDGALLHWVSDIGGAALPTENKLEASAQGHLAVVYAASTSELVVIDTSAGSIVQRFDAGGNEVSSIVFIGENIWYAHGELHQNAAIGRAFLSTGVSTPSVWDRQVYPGSEIDVSPSNINQVFMTHASSNPSRLYRFDVGQAAPTGTPVHGSFDPMVVRDDGTAIWAYREYGLTEIRPSDLNPTGRRLEIEARSRLKLRLVDDTNLVVSDGSTVETFSLLDDSLVGSAIFPTIIDLDVSLTEIVAVVEPNNLMITDLDYIHQYAEPVVESTIEIGDACPAVTDSVTRLYSAYFLRPPDVNGWAYWVNSYASGAHNMDSMSNFFAESQEFEQRYGALSDGAFVDLVYSNVLGRAPETSGRQFWLDQLASGVIDRGRLMINFSESEEYVTLTGTTIPLAGYFNWYPAGTTFFCLAGPKVFFFDPGDKHVDFYVYNTTSTDRPYSIRSRFDGQWYDDVSTSLTPGAAEYFLGVTVNMEAISIDAPGDLGWILVQSPVPLPTQRAGWPFLALQPGGADASLQANGHRSLIGS